MLATNVSTNLVYYLVISNHIFISFFTNHRIINSLLGILKKWQLVFYGTDTNPVRLRSPASPRPTLPNPLAVSTTGRDTHGMPAPPPPQPPPQQQQSPPAPVATPFTPTFSNIGRVNNPPNNQFFFPGTTGFRPSFFPNTGFPDFLQFAGSEPVTYRAPLSDPESTNASEMKNNCPKFSLNGYDSCCNFPNDFSVIDFLNFCVNFRSCVDACPTSGYYATPEMICLACHTSCGTCTGPEPYHCISCSANFYQIMDKTLCMENCPDGYFSGLYINHMKIPFYFYFCSDLSKQVKRYRYKVFICIVNR